MIVKRSVVRNSRERKFITPLFVLAPVTQPVTQLVPQFMLRFMVRIRVQIAPILCLFLLSGPSCSSVPTGAVPNSFTQGLDLMASGKIFQGRKLLELACDDGHKVSCWASGRIKSPVGSVSIAQHSTDLSSTQITVLAPKGESYRFFLKNIPTGKVSRPSAIEKLKIQGQVLFTLDFSEISLKNPETWRDGGLEFAVSKDQQVVDTRRLGLLNPNVKDPKVAIASCASDSFAEHKSQWTELINQNPDVLFFIGDNVYTDIKKGQWLKGMSRATLWRRYIEARQVYELFRSPKLVPIFATWDDHDYGKNNGDSNFRLKKEARKVFDAFFPRRKNNAMVSIGPGVSSQVRLGGQSFYFLDDRSFRSAPKIPSGQSHFGKEQEKWLYEAMAGSNEPVWLISGDQFFGGYHPHESYQGSHPMAFDQFVFKLRQLDRPVVFVSGDRHLTEIMKIPLQALGRQSYELTSSGIHTKVYPGSFKKWPNPLQIEGKDGVMNYMIVSSSRGPKGMDLEVKAYGPKKDLLFSRKLEVR